MRERVYVRPPKYSQDCWGPFSNGQAEESDLLADPKRPSVRTDQRKSREKNSKALERPAGRLLGRAAEELQQTAVKAADAKSQPGFQLNIPWTPFSETKLDRDLFERPYMTNTHSSAQSARTPGHFADLSAIGDGLPLHAEAEHNDSCDSLVREILANDTRTVPDPRKLLGTFLSHFADNLALEQPAAGVRPDREKTDKKKPASSSQKLAADESLKDRTMVACRSVKSQSEQDPSKNDKPLTFGKATQSAGPEEPPLADPPLPVEDAPCLPPDPHPAPIDHLVPLAAGQASRRKQSVERPMQQPGAEPVAIKRINRLSKKTSVNRAEPAAGTGQSRPRVSQIPKYPAGPQLHLGLEVRAEQQGGQLVHTLQPKSKRPPLEASEDGSADLKRLKKPAAGQAAGEAVVPMKELLVRICRTSLLRTHN